MKDVICHSIIRNHRTRKRCFNRKGTIIDCFPVFTLTIINIIKEVVSTGKQRTFHGVSSLIRFGCNANGGKRDYSNASSCFLFVREPRLFFLHKIADIISYAINRPKTRPPRKFRRLSPNFSPIPRSREYRTILCKNSPRYYSGNKYQR